MNVTTKAQATCLRKEKKVGEFNNNTEILFVNTKMFLSS